MSPKHPHSYMKSSQVLGAVGARKSTQRLWLKSKFLFECTKVSSRKMEITNDRRGEKKAKHTFGMHLRKETTCKAERCAKCRLLPSRSATPVTASPAGVKLQPRSQTDGQLQPDAPEGTCPMGRYSCVGTVACPTLLKPTRHSPGPDTCHLKRSYLLRGRWQ